MASKSLAFVLMSMVIGLTAPARAETLHVIELFTSQGCSSCPPADAFLGELAGRDDVLALGFHVDYWDYLGWKDTLGSAAFTERQRAYARRADGQVYTPQAVVDGAAHAVGSNREAVGRLLGRSLPVELTVTGDTVAVGAGQGVATLWRVDFTRRAAVPIARGENSGRTVTYVNAVRGVTRIGQWTGQPARYDLGACGSAEGADDCAVILQAGSGPGRILGAAQR